MPELTVRQPTFMRYSRVELILEQEPAFRSRMGPKSEAVLKPDGEKQLFSPEVIAVTQAIHDSGKDAHKVQKTEIIKAAVNVFRIGKPAQPVNGASNGAPKPAEEAPKAEAQSPAQAKPAAPAKPAAKQASKPAVKPKATAEAAPSTEPNVKKEGSEVIAPVRTEVDSNREVALQQARETINGDRPGENQAAYNAYISMYSLTLTTLQLVELYDNQPGKDKRLKTLDDLAKEFNKHTSIKSAGASKS